MTRVLLAEDNQTLLEDITLELEMRDYEVLQAMDGQVALEILRTTTPLPDIIVSDIAMPDVDGFKLLEYLRAEPEWNAIPFIFLTAFNSPNSVRIGKELGADDYIVKPFQIDDLILAMESKLRRIKGLQSHTQRD
jgi:DNA-binding response OmpR family regulator